MRPRCSSRQLYFCLIGLVFLILAIPGWASDQPILLSLYTDNLGVVSPSGRRLYAVVTKDGVMTYADKSDEGIVERSRTLTSVELAKLREVLAGSELTALRGAVTAGQFHPRDYQTSLEVMISRDPRSQEFTLVDYDPSAGRDFPAAARDLLCLVDRLRGSKYRLSQNCK